MKKKGIFGLALLLPLALLAGCGGSAKLSLSPNWYYQNEVENITGKSERLEYEVTFRQFQTEGTSVSYDGGTYVTELKAENYTQGEETLQVYHFHTELNISGKYTNGASTSPTFADSMVTDVWFTRINEGFRPIRSKKEVHSTVPYAADPDQWYATYEFTYNVDYAADLSSADYALNVTAPEAEKGESTGTVKIDTDKTFLDNEQIILGLRGLNLSSASSILPFAAIDPQTRRMVNVTLSTEAQNIPVSFECNGEQIDDSIDVVQVSCSYDSKQPGPPRRFVYVARTDDSYKKYRSVLIRFESAVMYDLGEMTYTLKKAEFNDR